MMSDGYEGSFDRKAQVLAPDASEVARVLGYLRTDEAQIRAAKANVVWADTMVRAASLIRTLTAVGVAVPSDPTGRHTGYPDDDLLTRIIRACRTMPDSALAKTVPAHELERFARALLTDGVGVVDHQVLCTEPNKK